MMKRTLAAVGMLLPVLFAGCMEEDWSLCPPEENLILNYHHANEKGTDDFADYIHAVDLLIFDRQLNLEGIYHSDKDSLTKFQGTRLVLSPGQYTIIALGNPAPDTRNSISHFFDSTVDLEVGNGGLPLFYAPTPATDVRTSAGSDELSVYKILIPKKGTIEKTLDFKRAHRTISVLVQNYSHPRWGADPQLEVRFAQIAHLYDLQLQVAPQRMDYTAPTELKQTPDGFMQAVKVNTPLQEIEENIRITITTPDGEWVCPPIGLKEFLVSQGIPLDAGMLHEINILVSFSGGQVTLKLPDWNDNAVNPVW